MAAAAQPNCPLCQSDRGHPFAYAHARQYHECSACRLIYLAPGQRLDAAAERAHYATHENDAAQPGYRAFLNRVAAPLVERLAPGAEGLDYGSGPGPALSAMLQEQGFRMEIYDPFFAPDPAPLGRSYDFITCTETAEHFFHPGREFGRLDRMLRPGGWLAIMTEMPEPGQDFRGWRYARDPTHVCFYRPRTMEWIAAHFGWEMHSPGRNVTFFAKPSGGISAPARGKA